jgi:hypothetical protein
MFIKTALLTSKYCLCWHDKSGLDGAVTLLVMVEQQEWED